MNNQNIFKALIKICNSYQEIVMNLDKSLDIITLLAANDEEIITVIRATKAESSDKLKEIQRLINYLVERQGKEILDDLIIVTKH